MQKKDEHWASESLATDEVPALKMKHQG